MKTHLRAVFFHNTNSNMPEITDNTLRGIILQKAYVKRREGFFQWRTEDFADLDPAITLDIQDIFRVCEQLDQHGLITFKSVPHNGQILDGRVKITGLGVDVIEGVTPAPMAINLD